MMFAVGMPATDWRKQVSSNAQREMLAEGTDPIWFEAEFWFYTEPAQRARAFRSFSEAVQQARGQCGNPVTIQGAAYHAALVQLPASAVAEIVARPELRLVQEEAVMYFRPVGQCAVRISHDEQATQDHDIEEKPIPTGHPIVALLDGLPLQNHAMLQNRLVVDDPLGWEDGYAAADRLHGTAMASLIIHGDLGNEGPALPHPLYVRPVMRPNPHAAVQSRQSTSPRTRCPAI